MSSFGHYVYKHVIQLCVITALLAEDVLVDSDMEVHVNIALLS